MLSSSGSSMAEGGLASISRQQESGGGWREIVEPFFPGGDRRETHRGDRHVAVLANRPVGGELQQSEARWRSQRA